MEMRWQQTRENRVQSERKVPRKASSINASMRKRANARILTSMVGKGRVHEENDTQTNQCIKISRPQDDLITIRVGMDDSCEAICAKCKGTEKNWA